LATPVGISDEQISVDGSSPQTSFAARSSSSATNPAPRLEHLEQARRLHVGDGFVRQPPLALALRRTLAQRRDHRACARDDLLR